MGVNEEFAFLLNDLTSQFTRFELAEFADLKSKYAKEFYRRAKQYRSSGIWKISRDEFCRLLSVPKSTAEQVRDLNKRVLKPIIEECGPLLGLKIERQYVKRRLSGFVFTFARETPPVIDARPVEARKAEDAGHWTSVAGYGEVFTTTDLFDVTAARDHFDGTVEAGECRFCAFDARQPRTSCAERRKAVLAAVSAPLGRLHLPWVDLPLFGLPLACEPVRALSDLVEQVGLGPGGLA